MIIDIVLVSTTLAIASSISYALWNSRRNEDTRIRRVIGLALFGAISIMLAKLIQLVVLVVSGDTTGSSPIVVYSTVAATIVVAVGISLLAISLLDMVMIGKHLWPKEATMEATTESVAVAEPESDEDRNLESDLELESMPAILFRRDAPLLDTKVSSVFLNNGVEDLLGFTREEMQSDPHFVSWLMHPEDRQDFFNGDERLATAGSEAVFDHRLKHKNGSYRWIRTVMKRIDNQAGAFKEIVGCCLDVTDLKEAEEQLLSILGSDPCTLIPEDEVI
ncbi:MAG: PAS domain-containing protein [Woeseiaceae bacterium]